MAGYKNSPYNQPSTMISGLVAGNWCNPPTAKVGLLPAAHPQPTTFPLLDAHVWGRPGRRRLVHQPSTETGPIDARLMRA